MALTTTKNKGVRQLADGQTPTIRADVAGIVDDIGKAVFASGAALPSASSEKWPGRSFFHTEERSWYVCDGSTWLSVGGQRSLALSELGSPASGYAYDSAGGASYAWVSGKRVEFRLRIKKNSGDLTHGEAVFNIATEYLPTGVGAWPSPGIQSGPTGGARVVGATINNAGAIVPLQPAGSGFHTLEISGFYYIP